MIYLPDQEHEAHYVQARLEWQFDGAIFVHTTTPVTPLPARRSERQVAG